MPTYIVLGNYTEQGIRSIKDLPTRVPQNSKRIEEMGGKLIGWYLTMGAYDFVAIVDAPNDDTMVQGLLALGAQGNFRTTTLKAFTLDEVSKIIARLP